LSFATEATARFSSIRLIALTNPDSTTAASVNTTVRDAALADAQARFKQLARVDPDSTIDEHVMVVMLGFPFFCSTYTGNFNPTLDNLFAKFEATCKAIGDNQGVTPATDSELTAVRDKRGETAEKKFAFEPGHWDDYAGT